MRKTVIRKPAVAGSWYPGSAHALAAAVDRHLAATKRDVDGDLVALVAPHAGLMYSGPVAAHAYRLLKDRSFDVVVLVAHGESLVNPSSAIKCLAFIVVSVFPNIRFVLR